MSLSTICRDDAYHSLEGLSDSRARVLSEIISHGPLTNAQIARRLGWTINRVTGRVAELRAMGRVAEAGTAVSEFGKSCVLWRAAVETPNQNGQFALRL